MKYILTKKRKGFEITQNTSGLDTCSYTRIPIEDSMAQKIFSYATNNSMWKEGCRIGQDEQPGLYNMVNQFFMQTLRNVNVGETARTQKVIVDDGGKWCLLKSRGCITLVDRNYNKKTNPDTINASYHGRVCVDDWTGKLFWKDFSSRKVYEDEPGYRYWEKKMESIFSEQQKK